MNKIVFEHYPASKLPDDMRAKVDPDATVTVTIQEDDNRPTQVMSLDEIFSLKGFRRRTAAEIEDDLRQQREEWNG